jgi:hypothetical protein
MMPLFKKLGPVFELKLHHNDGRPVFVGFSDVPDRNKTARYRRALRRGAKFSPIEVYLRPQFWGGGWEVVEGNNRYHAHRLEGRDSIKCRMGSLTLTPYEYADREDVRACG